MSDARSSNRTALRVFGVIALAALVLAYSSPDIQRLWRHHGVFGWAMDPDNVVIGVRKNSPAEKAGLKVGDRIDIASTNPDYRFSVSGQSEPWTLLPGQQVVVAIGRSTQPSYLSLVSEPDPDENIAGKVFIVAQELAMLLFVGIGATLVLLRPSITTWAFYFYCLGFSPAPNIILPLSLGLPWNYACVIAAGTMQMAGFVGVAVFASVFLHERSLGWRAIICRLAPVALLVLCGLNIYVSLASGWFGWPAKAANNLVIFLENAMVVVAMYGFVATYVSALGSDRQRIRWVVVGFGFALTGALINNFIAPQFSSPYRLYATLTLLGVVVPLTVGYAIIRHRIIDVSFVVSRALVYGILTTLLVGVFSLIDWFFTDYLRNTRLGTVAEVGAVLAFGIWFNSLHKRIDSFIDATFFRQRHKAELQLAKIAKALSEAPTVDTVARFLVNEPVRALSLSSAALFRRSRDGVFMREATDGWAPNDLQKLDAEDNVLLTLAHAEQGPLSLYDHPWRTKAVPSGTARPILALPIIVRRELAAIVFYGSHVHGEALDPDEIKAIAGLATGAAAAYDHLEAEAMKITVELLIRKNEALEARLAEAEIQPA